MSQFKITFIDNVTPVLRDLKPPRLLAAIKRAMGQSVHELLKNHFYMLDRERPNQLGGIRTHFWAKAAEETFSYVNSRGIVSGSDKEGVAQRYFGGTIRPVRAKFLTIPVHPDAHGRRARDFHSLTLIHQGISGFAVLARKRRNTFVPLFQLLPYVHQEGDTSVLPRDKEIMDASMTSAVEAFQQFWDN